MQAPTLNYQALTNTRLFDLRLTIAATVLLAILTPISLSVLNIDPVIAANMFFFIWPILVLIIVLVAWINRRRTNKALLEFAVQNNLNYVAKAPAPAYAGAIFGIGHSQKLLNAFGIPGESPIELGNYRYVTGSGKSSQTHNYGYMRLKLPRRLPHMMLDAQSNNIFKFSNLPQTFTKDQRLSLEGDFNNYFTLYAPQKYERDALYVFTPDVMQALVDHASDYDVEIIDDNLFIYSSKHFNLMRPDTWKKLLFLASNLGPEFESQTDYYADERVGDREQNMIASGGRRLKTKASVLGLLVLVVIVGQNLFSIFNFSDVASGYASIILVALVVVGGVYLSRRQR